MVKSLFVILAVALAASAFAGLKTVGPRETTVDEPFCAG